MKKFGRFVIATSKGIYDILATYLLLWVLPFAVAGWFYHLGVTAAAHAFDFESAGAMWERLQYYSVVPIVWVRLGLFLPLHIVVFRAARPAVGKVWPYVETAFDELVAAFRWMTDQLPYVRVLGEWTFTLFVTALLIPFVLQPTLVPQVSTVSAWVERCANLVDGTASAELTDSVVGFYRKLIVDPVVVEGLKPQDRNVFDQIDAIGVATGPVTAPLPNGKQPLMDRWDPYIRNAVGGDTTKFAMVKAFMWVESGGRQYAVSHTGCAGLMQFCVGTARTEPFRSKFGTGTVYRCDCSNGACRMSREMQRDLESGDPDALERHRAAFPCEMTDARFDPNRIIGAGALYVDRLSNSFGGNIYLMYIGYNSGPRVAERVYNKLGRKSDANLDEIGQHLADELRPTFGGGADARANGLLKRHLPKLNRAYQGYLPAQPVKTASAN